jgi:predicted Rdx family selenoprotein
MRYRSNAPHTQPFSRRDIDSYGNELDRLFDQEGHRWPTPLHQALARAVHTAQALSQELERAHRMIERYQETLLFYADPKNYDEEDRPGVGVVYPASIDGPTEYDFDPDGGNRARAALGVHIREVLKPNRDAEASVRAVLDSVQAETRGRR